MTIKRILGVGLVLCLCLSLCGCTSEGGGDSEGNSGERDGFGDDPRAIQPLGEEGDRGVVPTAGDDAPEILTGDDEIICGLPLAVELTLVNETFPLSSTEIEYIIRNNLSEPVYVLMIPRLERKNGDEWFEIGIEGVGFCGVPDQVEYSRSDSLPLKWYGDKLTEGEYRLSFAVVDGTNYSEQSRIAAIFELA